MVAFATQSNIQTTGSALAPIGANGSGKSKLLSAAELRSFASLYSQSELDSVFTSIAGSLSGKQATLVSGTNLKSINGTSLLGSGDLAVSASPAGSSGQLQFNDAGAFGGAAAVAYAAAGSHLTLTAQGAAINPFCVKGATSQSAYLVELRNGANTYVNGFDSVGNLVFGATTMTMSSKAYTRTDPAIRMNFGSGSVGGIYGSNGNVGFAAASSFFFDAVNIRVCVPSGSGYAIGGTTSPSHHVMLASAASGQMEVNNGTLGSYRDLIVRNLTAIAQSATDIPCVVRGAASQSANLTEWRDSSGAVMLHVSSAGRVVTRNGFAAANSGGTEIGRFTVFGSDLYVDNVAVSGTSIFRTNSGNKTPLTLGAGGDISATFQHGIRIGSLADGSAANNSVYYSTTQSKLCYKDSAGTVNALY